MHTSFEDLRVKLYNDQTNVPQEGSIGRMVDGVPVWDRPRTRREAGIEPWSTLAALSIGLAFPLGFCVVFWLLG